MIELTVLRDTREKKPWEFEDFPATLRDVTLRTGDYTLAELCDYDEEADTYHPRYAVERKSGQDFASSVTRGHERFKKEVKRASDWDTPLHVLIEEPKLTFKRNRGFMKYLDINRNHIFGTVEKWERYYNVEFHFVGSRAKAMQKCYDLLSTALRAELVR